MALQMTRTDEGRIRELIDDWMNAARANDIDGVMAAYAPDIRSFDAIAQLQFGVDAYRKHGKRMAMCPNPIFEINDLEIETCDGVASAISARAAARRGTTARSRPAGCGSRCACARAAAGGQSRTSTFRRPSTRRAARRCSTSRHSASRKRGAPTSRRGLDEPFARPSIPAMVQRVRIGPMATLVDERMLDERLARLEAARPWSPRVVSRLEALIRTDDDAALFRVNPLRSRASGASTRVRRSTCSCTPPRSGCSRWTGS